MANLKTSTIADGVGHLYRASCSLAKGDEIAGLRFLKVAVTQIGRDRIGKIQPLLTRPGRNLTTLAEKRYWAEIVLDEYKRLLNLLHQRPFPS